MCWPHWRRVPKALNRAIFDTCGSGADEEYEAVVAEAIKAVVAKENPSPHVWFKCPGTDAKCIEGRCMFCGGGLTYCTVCRKADGEEEFECPGYDL